MGKENWEQCFETFATGLISKHQIPGTAVGLGKEGEPIYTKGFGHRYVEKDLPVTADTVFGIASVTKSFTCVAIMQLEEAGKLSVHDPVVKFIPEFRLPDPEATQKVTIHHLMTHTAGIPPLDTLVHVMKRSLEADPTFNDYPGLHIEKSDQAPIDTQDQLIAYISGLDYEILGEPGTQFSYSNDSYGILGFIIARVSGLTFEDYIHQHILKPLGMNHSGFFNEELNGHDDVTELYAARDVNGAKEVYHAPVWWDSPAMRAAGKLRSSVNDMLKYAEIFRTGGVSGGVRILSEESVAKMSEPYVMTEPGKYYGYGLIITPDYHGYKLVEHSGNLKGIASHMMIIPEVGVTGVTLTNLAGVPAPQILNGAVKCYLGYEADTPHITFRDYEVSAEQLAEYVGTYRSNEGMEITVEQEGDTLVCVTSGTRNPMRSVGEDLFLMVVKDQGESLRFIRNTAGEIDRVAFHYRQFPKVGK